MERWNFWRSAPVAAVDMAGRWKNKMANKDTTNLIRLLSNFLQPFIDSTIPQSSEFIN
jgi:hypothetical protein